MSPKSAGLASVPRPPRPRPPEFGNIPPELKARRSWMPWRFSETPNKNGKFGKVPFGITDRKADFTDHLEWQLFETVIRGTCKIRHLWIKH